MSIEGEITVNLSMSAGQVQRVEIRSSRKVDATARLSGRSLDEVSRLVPLMFPVCGVAQGVACERAIDAALGRVVNPRAELARNLACLNEAAISLVWQLAITWREAAAEHPQLDLVRAARRAGERLHAAVFETRAASHVRASIDANEARGAARSLADATTVLLSETCPLAERVLDGGHASFGRESVATRCVSNFDLMTVAQRLAADARFAAEPKLDAPIDTSSFARHAEEIEVAEAVWHHGAGLLARLLARRAEARCVMGRLHSTLDDLLAGSSPQDGPVTASRGPTGEGVGLAETARGPLIYRVEASSNTVDDVRVVAPTDWTFHPRGVLARAIEGVDATPAIVRDVGWFIVALDPCVPWRIEVCDA